MSNMTTRESEKEWKRVYEALGVKPPRGAIQHNAYVLRAAARRLGAIGVRECNGVIGPDGFAKWGEADQRKADTERDREEKRIRGTLRNAFLASDFERLDIEFQGDPRGPAVYVHVKNGPQRVATFW